MRGLLQSTLVLCWCLQTHGISAPIPPPAELRAEIVLHPEDTVTVEASTGSTLTCVAYGLPLPDIIWLREGIAIQNESADVRIYETILVETNFSFIQSVLEICISQDHEGQYSCHANNSGGNMSFPFQIDVFHANTTIVHSPGDTVANASSVVSFSCSASGVPLPMISWFRDGSRLDPNTTNITYSTRGTVRRTSVLSLQNLQLSDAGRYSCRASDSISGADERNFTLTIQSAVDLIVFPTNTTSNNTDNLSFTCIAAGIPPPHISWLKNGMALTMDANITGSGISNASSYFTVSVLNLCNVQLSDSGLYVCAVYNNVTEGLAMDNASFYLAVQAAPNITLPPLNQTVSESTEVVLSCSVSGFPRPQVFWFMAREEGAPLMLNSTLIEEQPGGSEAILISTLTLPAIQPSQSGIYTCMASNNLGSDFNQATVTVYVIPIITFPHGNFLNFNAGSSTSLSCYAQGLPVPTLSWFRNGMEVLNGSYPTVHIYSSISGNQIQSTLQIQLLLSDLTGNFSCQALNEYGNDSRMFQLIVTSENVTIVDSPGDTDANVSSVVSFSCSASGIPLPMISWFKDGSRLDPNTTNIITFSTRGTVRRTSVLSLQNLQLSDAGRYSCRASDSISGADERNFTLTIQSAVDLIVFPTNTTSNNTDNLSFTCIAAGIPPPHISWLKNGMALTMDANITGSGISNASSYFTVSVLNLCNVQLSDSGLYVCAVYNNVTEGLAMDNASFYLAVQAAPNITLPPLNQTVSESTEVVLSCSVSGFPRPQVFWFMAREEGAPLMLNSTLIEEQPGGSEAILISTLTLPAIQPSQSGIYTCMASNFLGSDLNHATVTVYVPSLLVIFPSDYVANVSDSISAPCTARGYPTPVINWYKDGSLLISSPGVNITNLLVHPLHVMSVLELCDLQLSSMGRYSCIASNSLSSDSRNFSNVDTRYFNLSVPSPPVFTVHPIPEEVEVPARETIMLSCTVTGLPMPVLTWAKNGTQFSGNKPLITISTSVLNFYTIQSNITIGPAVLNTTGSYHCLAEGENVHGQPLTVSSNYTRVMFTSPPNLLTGPSDQALFRPTDIILNCQFESLPAANVTWSYLEMNTSSPVPISSGDTYNITMTTSGEGLIIISSTLTIKSVGVSAAGRYLCQAANGVPNSIGAVSEASAQLYFEKNDPTFVETPMNLVEARGTPLSLNCSAASSSNLTLFWTKNNSENFTGLTEAGNGIFRYNLIFTNPVTANSGTYTCRAVSPFLGGIIQATANLTVFTPASIVASSNYSTDGNVGDSLSFSCVVSASHTLEFVWLKEGTLLKSSTLELNDTLQNSTFTLDLNNVQVSDSGLYTCNASNQITGLPPASISMDFSLFVRRAPKVEPVENPVVVANGTRAVNITFRIDEAIPMVITKDILPNFTRYDGSPSSFNFSAETLSFSIETADIYESEGNYTLMASNPAGTSTATVYLNVASGPLSLDLEVKGNVRAEDADFIAIETRSVSFVCSFLADPVPSIQWLRNGRPINTRQPLRYILENTFTDLGSIANISQTLTLLSVQEQDTGLYSCDVSNVYGRDQTFNISLIVHIPPTVIPIESRPIGVETRDGRPSAITIGFSITRAFPPVQLDNITWMYFDQMTMEQSDVAMLASNDTKYQLSDNLRMLVISNLSFFDAGLFTLNATNEAGTGSATLELIVHVEPILLNESYSGNETVENSTAIFICIADGFPLPNIVWLHNETFILTSSRRIISTTMVEASFRPHISEALNSTLTVTGVRLRDAGEYFCRVDPSNIDRGTPFFSSIFELNVVPEPIDYCTPSPCGDRGVCSNQTSGYLCTCNMGWRGVNCTIRRKTFIEVNITKDPELPSFPELFMSVTLTCEAEGDPQPNITWYKDGVLLKGENRRTLVIREIDLNNRGFYHCNASNFDPNDSENRGIVVVQSKEAVVNIKGITQYRSVMRIHSQRRRRRATEDESSVLSSVNLISSRLSGVALGSNATIYSVTRATAPNGTDNTSIPLLITVLAPQGGSPNLTRQLVSRLQVTAMEINEINITVESVERFDGCKEEKTVLPPLEPNELTVVLEWPETDIGVNRMLGCPCGNLSAITGSNVNRTAQRMCVGSFSTGAVWDTAMVRDCNFTSTTRRLCQVANLVDEPEEAISTLDNITSDENNLAAVDIEITTSLLETVSNNINDEQLNRNLSGNFLTVVDNLLDVNQEEIQQSQEASNTSARILNVIEDVAEKIPLPENKTSVVIPLTSFAISVREVDPDMSNFTGLEFSANFGDSFEFNSDQTIETNALSFSKTPNFTAILNVPASVFNISMTQSSNRTSAPPRITNSVFLSDTLFVRRTKENLTVGSLVMAAALSNNRRVENLANPIRMTFLKSPSVENGTDPSCNFWDLGADAGFGDWSTSGCKVVEENDTSVTCECDHLTNFAILLDLNPVRGNNTPPPEVQQTLTVFSYIGTIVSIICLVMTILTYTISKKLRTSEPGQLLINLSLGFIGVYSMFIVSSFSFPVPQLCATSGALLHYFLLVAFFMMVAEAISLFLKLVIVLGIPHWLKNRYVLKAALIAWITPIFIVVASIAPNWTNYTGRKDIEFCYPRDGPFYGGLIAPFILIYIINWFIFVWILVSLLSKKKTSEFAGKRKQTQSKFKQNFIIALILSILFGLGWGVGLAATSSGHVVISTALQALFVVLTSFQGLWIFLMHCVRSDEARKEWKRWVYVLSCQKIKISRAPKKMNSTSGQSSTAKRTQNMYGMLSTSDTLKKTTNYEDSVALETCLASPLDPVAKVEKKDLSLHPEESLFFSDTSNSCAIKDNGMESEVMVNPVAEGMSPQEDILVISPTPPSSSNNDARSEQIELMLVNPGNSTEGLDLIDVKSLRGDNNTSETKDRFNILWVDDTDSATQSPTAPTGSDDIIENIETVLGASNGLDLGGTQGTMETSFANTMSLDFNHVFGTDNVLFESEHEDDFMEIHVVDGDKTTML